jgi:hypothetical protein
MNRGVLVDFRRNRGPDRYLVSAGRLGPVRREWEPEDLVGAWTLLDDDWELLANKSGATRLAFGLMLKFFALDARFPRHAGEFPKAAVDYMAGQVGVDAAVLAECRWSGSTIEYHRKQIRDALRSGQRHGRMRAD